MRKFYTRIVSRSKDFFPILFFFWMTYIIFAPSTLFLNNIDEFRMHYIYLLPTFCIMSVIVLTILVMPCIALPDRFVNLYYVLIFTLTLCIYIQMNFLNPPFRTLDGADINWNMYSYWGYLSPSVWIFAFLIVLIFFLHSEKSMKKIAKYCAIFLSLVQFVSLVIMIVMAEVNADNYGRFAFLKEEQFSIGEEKNIVVFVVDSLQVEAMKEYSINHAESLNDFTFFTNTVSGGAPTHGGMPVLLTGIEYDPMQSHNDYCKEIWEQTHLYDDLEKEGYDIRFFTCDSTDGMPEGYIKGYEKISTAVVSNHKKFIPNIYKLVNFITFPQQLKKYFCVSTEDITDNIGTYAKNKSLEQYYDIDDLKFYDELLNSELDDSYDKTFRLYHLNGAHPPFRLNEKLERVEESATSEIQQIAGVMKIIILYIEKLKSEGLYDQTTIIVTGDHGQHEVGNLMINPAILIKRAGEHHGLVFNNAPICFRNVVATIIQEAGIDYSEYGPTVYDIRQNSDIERLHTFPTSLIDTDYFEIDDCWKEEDWYRIRVDESGNAHTWNPYQQNRINYDMGDIIAFDNQNDYGRKLNYRIYKENGNAILSNEVTMCFNFENIKVADIIFTTKIAEVYNDSQKMKIYVNGKYIEDVVVTAGAIGENISFVIPKEMICDMMVIRLVFPGAVTPNMMDDNNQDSRILSIGINEMQLEQK